MTDLNMNKENPNSILVSSNLCGSENIKPLPYRIFQDHQESIEDRAESERINAVSMKRESVIRKK